MIKVYFDEILIDEDSYAALSNDYKLFTDNFYLGSTASNTFKLSVAKTAVTTQPSEVKITDDTNTYYLIIDKITDEKKFYIYDLVDKLVLFNFNYDASVLIDANKENEEDTYLSDILEDMCNQANVVLDPDLLLINNIKVDWYDNTLLARDYLSFIAELQGGYARILDNGKLTIVKHKMTSQSTIQIDSCEDFVVGERKQITRVVYDNGVAKYEYGLDSGNTLYINPNNVFITETETVLNIYNEVVGLEFYLIETGRCQLDPDVRAGDIITFTDGTNSYPTIAGYSASYGGGYWLGNYSFNLVSKQQEETQTIGIDTKLLSIKTTINRAEAEITTIASRVDDAEEEITTVTQRVDGVDIEVAKINPLQTKTAQLEIDVNQLRSEIGDVTDITTQEEGNGTLEFESINVSEPINVTIRPTSAKDISYIYPSSALFPSSTLFPQVRILRFTNTTTSEVIDYTLPGNLRYYDADNYDEFILDFATTTCKIIRKIDISASMVKTLKETPVEETYTYPTISLTAGNYTVTMPGYSNAYMKIRLMSQNMYTSQFATRVEVSSAITQSSNEINLEVAKKTDKTAIISTINQTAEAVKINASKVDITGVLTAINNDTSTTINGNKITTGSITASQVSSSIITTTNFSAQNINADKIITGTLDGTKATITNINASNISSGTISTARLNSDVITTTNFSAQNINADRIIAGTINGTNVNITNLNATNIKSGRLNITSGNYYLRMGFAEGSNPSVSGLNVGHYGIKAYSGIVADHFGITDSDTGKSVSIQVTRQGGGYYYMTFTGGILTAWERY